MSNNDIIYREAIADSLHDLSKDNESTIEDCISRLNKIKESKKITETNLRELINVWRELDSLREQFYIRILYSLKRGNMIIN